MSALHALIQALPAICQALGQIDPRWHEQVFHALVNAALADARANTEPAGAYGAGYSGYDAGAHAETGLLPRVDGTYDPRGQHAP